MFTKFLNLDSEKRDRILNAAMEEFAHKGYKNASTNEIVVSAGIAKGLLFHYFKNKKQLFLFLFDYSVELITNEIYEKCSLDEPDIFLRLRQIMLFKMGLLRKYPEAINFLKTALTEDSADVRGEVEQRKNESLSSSYAKVFEGIDFSLFKEGIDIKRAINVMMWTFDGLGNAEFESLKQSPSKEMDYDRLYREADAYLNILRDTFYK